MIGLKLLYCSCLIALTLAQDYQTEYQSAPIRQAPLRLNSPEKVEKAPPIAILKQINKHNEDGSYTYGYEGADGSFKIETKLATGEVKGKYGYVDETGEVRIVEYGANKYGFQPSGKGITVAPPTLVDETTNKDGINPDYDEYEQPQAPIRRPQPQQAPRASRPRPVEQPQYFSYDEPKYAPAPAPVPAARPKYTQTDIATGPAPPRLQIPGAAPVDVTYSERPRPPRPDNVYTSQQSFGGPQQFPSQFQAEPVHQPIYRPAPKPQLPAYTPVAQPKQVAYSAPRFANQPHQPQQHFAPAQQPQPQQHQSQPQPQPQQYAPAPQQKQYSQGRSTSSLLDQLAKDYALPQGGSPALHDITFGYY